MSGPLYPHNPRSKNAILVVHSLVRREQDVPLPDTPTATQLSQVISQVTAPAFLLGAAAVILAVFYTAALHLIGLEHGALIGFAAGVIGFIPYVGSLLGVVVSTCIAIAQFWPNWSLI